MSLISFYCTKILTLLLFLTGVTESRGHMSMSRTEIVYFAVSNGEKILQCLLSRLHN